MIDRCFVICVVVVVVFFYLAVVFVLCYDF